MLSLRVDTFTIYMVAQNKPLPNLKKNNVLNRIKVCQWD